MKEKGTMNKLIIISLVLVSLFGLNNAFLADFLANIFKCQSRFNRCIGLCWTRNSRCGRVTSSSISSCGCTYCNYNKDTNKCYGECENRQLSQCVPQITVPKADKDCKYKNSIAQKKTIHFGFYFILSFR